MVDQDEIHRMARSEDVEERKEAIEEIRRNITFLHDKQLAWEDLIRLAHDKDVDVKWRAAKVLSMAFPQVPDKNQAWFDLIQLFTLSRDSSVIRQIAVILGIIFSQVPDKNQAWKDLHLQTLIGDKYLLEGIAWAIREGIAWAIGLAYSHIPDKNQAWGDLILLIKDDDRWVQNAAAWALGKVFSDIPDKQLAWEDLHQLSQNGISWTRGSVAYVIGAAFSQIPDKNMAWADLHRLTQDIEYVRFNSIWAVGAAFSYVPDKKEAWEDIHRLTKDHDKYIRGNSVNALGMAFSHIPDKNLAWDDLHSLTLDKDDYVRKEAAWAISVTFSIIPDKKQALDDLHRLVHDQSIDVRIFANYSLAKSSIFKATEVEKKEDIQEELENALVFFERASNEAIFYNPAQFCLPFYRAFHAIKFKEQRAEAEVQKYLEEAKKAVSGSNCREKLLEVIKYLEEALRKKPENLNELRNNLNDCRRCFEYADSLLVTTEKNAPLATKLLRKEVQNIYDIFKSDPNDPRIQTVHICDTQNETVRIAVIQFCYELTNSFPPVIENKDAVKAKIFSGLDIAKKERTNIACLPELCLCEEWIPEIEKKYPDMIVIGGGFYKDNRNVCPVITKSDIEIFPQSKITPSAHENPEMCGNGMISGDRIYKYETRFGKFVILICRDFDRFAHYFRENDIDFIFCPAFNDANKRFHAEANNHVTKTPSYILIANTGIYGGTSIFALLNKNYFNRLVGDGCKDEGDLEYKLCEVKKGKEEVIIADFNLTHKTIQIPTPSEPSKEKRSTSRIKKMPIL